MSDLLNPYIAGAPVVESNMFFGRKEIFTWIEDSLSGKYVDHILVLHGQRRVGKTTVLKQIPNFLNKKYLQVFFDLQGRTNATLDRFLWWMSSEIIRTLNSKKSLGLTRLDRSSFIESDNFITDFLPEMLQNLNGDTLLLTFDEFDALSRPDIQDSLTRPLISFLRRLFDVNGLNFIFSIGSSGNKLENMQASYTDFFKSALYRKVSFLTDTDCRDLIIKPVEGVIKYEPKAISRIQEIASGHPYFTQLTCHELFSQCQKTGSRTITLQNVDDILEDVIERGTVNLKFVWDEASDLEKWILAALAKEEGAPLKKVSQTLKNQGVRSSDSDLNSAILHLRDKDVINKDNLFIIHLMKLWLEMNRPMDRVREELVQVNPIANRYIEIGDEYQDRNQTIEALNSYQQALEVQPNNTTALFNIASIYLGQKEYQLASSSFIKILEVDEEHVTARQGYCQTLLALAQQSRSGGKPDEAIDSLLAILNINSAHAEARQTLAIIYQQKAETHLKAGADQKALEIYQLAIEMLPEDKDLSERYQNIIVEKKNKEINIWFDKAERAIKRNRWDEAIAYGEEALAVDPEIEASRSRLAEIKDAPRQEKIRSYRQTAEAALIKEEYGKAIEALEAATLLAPEDKALQEWVMQIKSDQKQAYLAHLAGQATQAEAAGEWERAIKARQDALDFNPEDPELVKALETTQAKYHQAQLDKVRRKIEQARAVGHWDEAILAAKDWLALAPDDDKVKALIDSLEEEKYQAELERLLKEAEVAYQTEQWSNAVFAWEAYLKEVPEETEKFQKKLEKARKYARISSDYTTAQSLMRKKQYNKAIGLLQGIIAEDPTYHATSRLLVEAVEASRQKKPIWKKGWVYVVLIVLIVATVGVIFQERILSAIETFKEIRISTESSSSTIAGSSLIPSAEISAALTATELRSATLSDIFFYYNDEWGTILSGDYLNEYNLEDQITDGHLILPDTEEFPQNNVLDAKNFVLKFNLDYFSTDEEANPELNLYLHRTNEGPAYIEIKISENPREYKILQRTIGDSTVLDEGILGDISRAEFVVVCYEDSLAIFLNDVLFFQTDGLESSGDHNFFDVQGFRNDNDAVAGFDDIKFWNLYEIDPIIEAALTYVEDSPVTYSDDYSNPEEERGTLFSDDDLELNINDFVMDGYFIPQNTNAYDPQGIFNGNNFVLTFSIDYFDSTNPEKPSFNLLMQIDENVSSHTEISISKHPPAYEIYKSISDGSDPLTYASGTLEETSRLDFVVVLYQGLLTVVVNDELILSENNIESHGSNNIFSFTNFHDDVNDVDLAGLDEIHFWNLDNVELEGNENNISATNEMIAIEPILTYIENTPSNSNDDFSSSDGNWATLIDAEDNEFSIGNYINDGYLVPPNITPFSQDDLHSARNFVLVMDINHFIPDYYNVVEDFYSGIGIHLRISDDQFLHNNLDFTRSISEIEITYENNQEDIYQIIDEGTSYKSSSSHLVIVVYQNHLALLINEKLVVYYDELETIRAGNSLSVEGFYNSDTDEIIAGIDSIAFWNLDGIEIDTSGNIIEDELFRKTQFLEEAAKYMDENPATFEDDFSIQNDDWGLAEIESLEGVIRNSSLSNYFTNGVLHFPVGTGIITSTGGDFHANDMILNMEFIPYESFKNLFFQIRHPDFSYPYSYEVMITKDGWVYVKEGIGYYRLTNSEKIDPLIISEKNQIQILAIGNTLAVNINEENVIFFELANLRGTYTKMIIESRNNSHDIMDITSFSFWNLDNVEFAITENETENETINASQFSGYLEYYMQNNEPTFSDEFEYRNDKWGTIAITPANSDTQLVAMRDFITDGFLHVPAESGNINIENANFNTNDFILSMVFYPYGGFDSLDFYVRKPDSNSDVCYHISLSHSRSILLQEEGNLSDDIIPYEASIPYSDSSMLLITIVAKGNRLAVYRGDREIFTIYDASLTGSFTQIGITSLNNGQNIIDIDEISFWNLDGVDIIP